MGTHVEIEVGGARMGAYVARPDGEGPFPGVVVGMELFGVDQYVRSVCDRLAGAGFTAVAPDYHHRTAPGVELPRDDDGRVRGFALLHEMTREQAVEDTAAAVAWLRADGALRVGMVGLSMGGHIAYLAATAIDLDAVAVFYGGWLTTTQTPLGRPEPTLSRTPSITGRVMYLVGEEDHVVPPAEQKEIREALESAGAGHEFVAYTGVGHRFLDTAPDVAEDAWQRVEVFLKGADATE